uniref:NADH dehydrogenase subunit 2 n=1 Tax=Marmessoidea bispina TaxID=2878957 RepID=UPI0025A9BAEE|nr:NADH dehydrogenase subunit 2 [Marmessoidea bispina]WID87068.1 NADH dehydrogenase subunit 2 [Marmessoidea bispina]
MMNKSTNMLFMTILLMSVPISISSNSWFMIWMGMEINIMSFMPIMMNHKNMLSKEAGLTYFMTQTIASMLMIMSFMLMTIKEIDHSKVGEMLTLSSLMIKSGMSPFHFWLPKTMEGMNWNNCFILMTWQKIIPLMMMSNIIKMNYISILAMMMSIITGAIGGLNQTSLRKLMAYSSISNNGWMMMAMLVSEKMWMVYLIMYTIMMAIMTKSMSTYKNFHMNQIISMNEAPLKKLLMMINMVSMSGLPPMMGFLPKWMVIQQTMMMNMMFMTGIMVIMTLISAYYYLRTIFSIMMLSTVEMKWKTKFTKTNTMIIALSMMTINGLMLVSLMWI